MPSGELPQAQKSRPRPRLHARLCDDSEEPSGGPQGELGLTLVACSLMSPPPCQYVESAGRHGHSGILCRASRLVGDLGCLFL